MYEALPVLHVSASRHFGLPSSVPLRHGSPQALSRSHLFSSYILSLSDLSHPKVEVVVCLNIGTHKSEDHSLPGPFSGPQDVQLLSGPFRQNALF